MGDSVYLKNGTCFTVASRQSLDMHETLPAGNYVIKQSMQGLYLDQIDAFQLPEKLYGVVPRHTDRVLQTFLDRPSSTGVMLAGEKGSGKSLLAKNISIVGAQQHKIPTIVINAPWVGDAFNDFIQRIQQPAIVLFDEFEKVYAEKEQEGILTLLDGVFPSKKLFMITCNDKYRVNVHMRNRPGRVYYMLDFKGLDVDFIREYCQDKLNNKDYVDNICKLSTVFDSFNFDMLKALVEEMNRYNETPQQAIALLNTKPEFSGKQEYEYELIIGGQKIDPQFNGGGKWTGNPMIDVIDISYYYPNPQYNKTLSDSEQDEDEYECEEIQFTPGDLKRIDSQDGRFVYKNGANGLTMTKVKFNSTFSYSAF